MTCGSCGRLSICVICNVRFRKPKAYSYEYPFDANSAKAESKLTRSTPSLGPTGQWPWVNWAPVEKGIKAFRKLELNNFCTDNSINFKNSYLFRFNSKSSETNFVNSVIN